MTKKDFQLIAATIASTTRGYAEVIQTRRVGVVTKDQQRALAEHFADALASTNPLFKRDLFIQAATGQVAPTARKAERWPDVEADVYEECKTACGRCGVEYVMPVTGPAIHTCRDGFQLDIHQPAARRMAKVFSRARRTLASDLAEDR